MSDWVQIYSAVSASAVRLLAQAIPASTPMAQGVELIERVACERSEAVGLFDENGDLVAIVEVVERPHEVWIWRLALRTDAGPVDKGRLKPLVLAGQTAGNTRITCRQAETAQAVCSNCMLLQKRGSRSAWW